MIGAEVGSFPAAVSEGQPQAEMAAPTKAELLVIGLGYVGLPLAAEAVRAGLGVTGVDLNTAVVDGLNAGRSHIADVTDSEVAEMVRNGFLATADAAAVRPVAAVVICVPTPLTHDSGPDLSLVESAAATAATVIRPGALVILESTTYPGTTEEVVRPILERGSGLIAGVDFNLAFSPERIDPGNREFGLRNTPKVVGGLTKSCTYAAANFYAKMCDEVVCASSAREAEMAKLLENTYRHVNIALVNEMAIFCHELGIDLWDAIRCAATKPFGFQEFRPGPGVGGHCIPIDPSYLSYKVRTLGYPFRFVELAQEINRRMPSYVVTRAAAMLNQCGKPLSRSSIILLGITYKKDSHDLRETPAADVARQLLRAGSRVTYVDPYVPEWMLDGQAIERADSTASRPPSETVDLAILLQEHSAFDAQYLRDCAPLLLDTRGTTTFGERL